jgi:hypothetical protein
MDKRSYVKFFIWILLIGGIIYLWIGPIGHFQSTARSACEAKNYPVDIPPAWMDEYEKGSYLIFSKGLAVLAAFGILLISSGSYYLTVWFTTKYEWRKAAWIRWIYGAVTWILFFEILWAFELSRGYVWGLSQTSQLAWLVSHRGSCEPPVMLWPWGPSPHLVWIPVMCLLMIFLLSFLLWRAQAYYYARRIQDQGH